MQCLTFILLDQVHICQADFYNAVYRREYENKSTLQILSVKYNENFDILTFFRGVYIFDIHA